MAQNSKFCNWLKKGVSGPKMAAEFVLSTQITSRVNYDDHLPESKITRFGIYCSFSQNLKNAKIAISATPYISARLSNSIDSSSSEQLWARSLTILKNWIFSIIYGWYPESPKTGFLGCKGVPLQKMVKIQNSQIGPKMVYLALKLLLNSFWALKWPLRHSIGQICHGWKSSFLIILTKYKENPI